MKGLARSAAVALRLVTLAVEPGPDGALPTEFRLFVSGWNDTENGRYLFDTDAATAVMAAYQAWGVDLMIDLEHQALEPGAPIEPTARDARGWCKLELRDDGSLWAVSVSWTPDGEARLREKRQRYVSPAFEVDEKSSRVTKIINIAITAIPATHDTPALVAASARIGRGQRDLRKLSSGLAANDVFRALDKALMDRFSSGAGLGCEPCPWPWIADVFDATVVYELGGKFFEVTYTLEGTTAKLGDPPVEVIRGYAPAPTVAPTEPTTAAPAAATRKIMRVKLSALDPKFAADAMAAVKDQDGTKALALLEEMIAAAAAGGETAAPADGGGDGAAAASATNEEQASAIAAARAAMTLTGKPNAGAAMAELARRSAVAVEVEQREATLAADRATLEATERRSLVGELVKLGVEIPATAWSDEKGTVPVERLAKEPIAELRSRVAALSAAPGGLRTAPKAPASGGSAAPGGKDVTLDDGKVVALSAREVAMCGEMKVDPKEYAAKKAGKAQG